MPFDLQCRLKLGGSAGTDLTLVAVSPFLQKILTALVTSPIGGTIQPYDIHTYQNPFSFTQGTVVGDLTESAYPGYAEQGGTAWSPPGFDDDGNVVMVADLPVPFQVTADPAGELLAGVYILDADGDLAFGLGLDVPIALTDGLLIPMTFVFQLGNLP